MNALGNESVTVKLDAVLRASLTNVRARIIERIPSARFSQVSPGEGGKLEVVVLAGTTTSARQIIKEILREIYSAAFH